MAILSEDDKQKLLNKLENDGEEKVKSDLAGNIYGQWKISTINNWLEKKAQDRQAVALKENLDMKKEANTIAKNQNLISWIALFVSVLSFGIALIALLYK